MAALGWVLAALAAVVAIAGWATASRRQGDADAVDAVGRELLHARDQVAALTTSHDRILRVLEAIPQGVVIAKADGEVVHRNAAATDFLTARHGEALVEAAIRELLDDALTGRSADRSVELYGPPRRVLDVTAVPLSGLAGGALVIVDDVSERSRLEAVRRDFVANISHELKTPVGAIGLLAETLLDESDPAVVERLAERMVNEAFRVARTIDDLLELSRIEVGDAPMREPVPVDLTIAEAADRIRPAAELRGITLRTHQPPARLTVLGDRRQLVSALYNLLDNAVKYSEPGSEVTLRARTDVSAPGGRRVELSVEDQGLGIPPRDLTRIFERFYRVDQARSRNTGGTGLGLAIVRHVVGNHDGEVGVESHEGHGSTFTLKLPAGPGPVAVAPPEADTG